MARQPSSAKTIIVGAGPGGLASAMLLAKAGFDVTVLERRDRVFGVDRSPRGAAAFLRTSVGVGGIYDQWRRGKALVQGRRFNAAHGDGAS